MSGSLFEKFPFLSLPNHTRADPFSFSTIARHLASLDPLTHAYSCLFSSPLFAFPSPILFIDPSKPKIITSCPLPSLSSSGRTFYNFVRKNAILATPSSLLCKAIYLYVGTSQVGIAIISDAVCSRLMIPLQSPVHVPVASNDWNVGAMDPQINT